MTTRILFVINSLRGGGAEKVLVNLVNGLDSVKYDITVLSLFGEGENKQFLNPNIHFVMRFKKAPKGIVHWSKLFSPKFLHRWLVRGDYDIEISCLQGITTRVVAGAPSKVHTISWIHNFDSPLVTFRNTKEMLRLFNRNDMVMAVSRAVEQKIIKATNEKISHICVIYNVHDIDGILKKSQEPLPVNLNKSDKKPILIAVGTIYPIKGFKRLLECLNRLKQENYYASLWFVGDGPQREELELLVKGYDMEEDVVFFGFDKNPYKYMSKADWMICSSYTEGFSGTVSEATILGIPTLTTRCAGMDDILGENNEYGIIVENNDEALYEGLKQILSRPSIHEEYKKRVNARKDLFNPSVTIKQVEQLFDSL